MHRMASLKEQLDEYKAGFLKKVPKEALEIVGASTKALIDSIPSRKVPKVGDKWPEFSLPDSKGKTVNSSQLLQQGPLIISLFRGKW